MFLQPPPKRNGIIKNISLWLLLEVSGSQTKTKTVSRRLRQKLEKCYIQKELKRYIVSRSKLFMGRIKLENLYPHETSSHQIPKNFLVNS